MALPTPEILLQGCLRGEAASQEGFYRHFAPRLMAVCLRYTRSRAQAEDLLQESFIKIFTRLAEFRNQGSLEGWVHRLVVTTAIDQYRSEVRLLKSVDLDQAAHLTAEDTDQLEQLSVQETLDLINQLPPGYRLVINLYAIEGYSHKEIGKMLGIEENTSCSQLFKARKMLSAMMCSQKKEMCYERK